MLLNKEFKIFSSLPEASTKYSFSHTRMLAVTPLVPKVSAISIDCRSAVAPGRFPNSYSRAKRGSCLNRIAVAGTRWGGGLS